MVSYPAMVQRRGRWTGQGWRAGSWQAPPKHITFLGNQTAGARPPHLQGQLPPQAAAPSRAFHATFGGNISACGTGARAVSLRGMSPASQAAFPTIFHIFIGHLCILPQCFGEENQNKVTLKNSCPRIAVLTTWVAFRKLLNLSVPQFPHGT